MVANFFSVDFQTLDARERALLEPVARHGEQTLDELARAAGLARETTQTLLFGLGMMGYLSEQGGRYRIGNWFFERWLRRASAAEAKPV
jgi:DNA-binding IclR family transcriptional regulator